MIKLSKQKLLVWFLAFTLLGIQVVQSSPIHDHIQHQVDCVLCHFDTHDQASLAQADVSFFQRQGILLTRYVKLDYYSFHYPSYQGRSPPNFYS